MRVCIVSHEYSPNIVSGLGTSIGMLSEELLKNGFEVTVVTPKSRGGKSYEKNGKLEVFRIGAGSGIAGKIPDPRIAFSAALRKFKKRFDFTAFDLLHVYDVHDSYFLDRKIKAKVPVVISVNDFYSYITPLNLFRFPYPCEGLLKRYLHYSITRYLNKKYIKMADFIMTNTDYAKKVLVERGVADGESIGVVHRSMETGNFIAGKNKYKSHKILYIGNNMERKGVIHLLEAMEHVLEKYPDSKLTIIGRPRKGMEKRILGLLRKKRLENHVEMIPFLPPSGVAKRFSAANVFVLPSLIENLAVTLLEAMASATPVVCTNVGANTEAVDRHCGFAIAPRSPESIAEKITEIFSNPELASRMGSSGKDRISKKFRKSDMGKKTIGVYRKTISSRKR